MEDVTSDSNVSDDADGAYSMIHEGDEDHYHDHTMSLDFHLDESSDDGSDTDVTDFNMTEDEYFKDIVAQSEVRSEKRGRPVGYKKHQSTDAEHTKKKVKKELIPLGVLVAYLCCSSVCLASVAIEKLKAAREAFQHLGVLKRSQWILDWIITHTRRPENRTVFLLSGFQVCQKAWLACLGIPLSTFYAVRTKFLDGAQQLVGPGNVPGKTTAETQYALSWLTNLSSRYADKMPDSHKLHLPCCLKKKDVYNMMCVEAEVYGGQIISMTHFLRVWARFLPHIIIPKRSRFTACDVCIKLKTHIEQSTNREQKKKLFELREIHLQQQNLERQKYYKHAQKAKSNTNRYLSVILDGMDQDKTSLPHSTSSAKGLSNLWKLKVNLMGAIVHGYGAYGFFDTFQWAHGSSFAISVLIHTLLMMTSLPPILYLQLDNCPGQNKNRYMLGFLAALVEYGIFDKVKLSFLMVGHTHEDIDQLFSRFSTWLSYKNIRTLDDLIVGFEKCFTPSPTGINLQEVFNIAEFLPLNDISNHSRPHVFKIIKENGKAVIFTKKWSTDKLWTPCEGDHLLKHCPSGPLALIAPMIDRIDEKVINDVQTFASFYRDNKMAKYWESYFKELKETEDNWQHSARPIMQMLQEKRQEEIYTDIEDLALLMRIPNLSDPIPPVRIGKKKKQDREQSLNEGLFVLLDWAKYADEWPQVAKVLKLVSPTEVEIHWYKGAKTTVWTPASRRIKGGRGGKSEPFVETVNKTVIWFNGFTLTPSGNLPKHVRQEIDSYFD